MKHSIKSNKNILLGVFSIFLILALLPMVLADYSVNKGENSHYVCPRDTQVFLDSVSNHGDFAEFTLSVGGGASAWSTVIPSGFILLNGETKTVYTYVTSACPKYCWDGRCRGFTLWLYLFPGKQMEWFSRQDRKVKDGCREKRQRFLNLAGPIQ